MNYFQKAIILVVVYRNNNLYLDTEVGTMHGCWVHSVANVCCLSLMGVFSANVCTMWLMEACCPQWFVTRKWYFEKASQTVLQRTTYSILSWHCILSDSLRANVQHLLIGPPLNCIKLWTYEYPTNHIELTYMNNWLMIWNCYAFPFPGVFVRPACILWNSSDWYHFDVTVATPGTIHCSE